MAAPIAQWKSQEARLRSQLIEHRSQVTDLIRAGAGQEQIAQAGLRELAAVKQCNEFLGTAGAGQKIADQLDRQLRFTPDMPSGQRQYLEFQRDAINQRAGEFQEFANANHLQPAYALPVRANGKIYYDNGKVEWDTSTLKGMAGAAGDSVKSALPMLGDWLTPNNATNNMACNSVLGTLTGMAQGMTFQLPNVTGHAGKPIA